MALLLQLLCAWNGSLKAWILQAKLLHNSEFTLCRHSVLVITVCVLLTLYPRASAVAVMDYVLSWGMGIESLNVHTFFPAWHVARKNDWGKGVACMYSLLCARCSRRLDVPSRQP